MKNQFMLLVMSLFFCSLSTFAKNKTHVKNKQFCGKPDGTAGNALLVDKNGNEIVTLSVQGDGGALLDQTDFLVGENSGVKGEEGTQNGIKYCIIAEINTEGEPTKIIKAWYQK